MHPGSGRGRRSGWFQRGYGPVAPAPCGCRNPPEANAWQSCGARCAVWAGLAMPTSRNVRFMPRCNTFSSPWRRRMTLDADQCRSPRRLSARAHQSQAPADKKLQRPLRRVPDRGPHLAGYREMRQEHFDLGRSHIVRGGACHGTGRTDVPNRRMHPRYRCCSSTVECGHAPRPGISAWAP